MINLGAYPKKLKHFSNPKTSRKKVVYKYVFSEKHGCPRRVENGYVDIQDMIQSYADDVDFKSIGKMLVDTRDNVVSHFDMNGEIMDVTGLPRNIHEYEALHNKIKAEFEKLPDDMKALFGNDINQFSKSWQSGQIGSVLETYYKSLEAVSTTGSSTSEGGAE